MSSTTLRRRLAMTFVAAAALTVLGVAVALVVSLRLYAAQERVVDTLFDAYSATQDLDQAMLEQETAFRGLALTGDEEFLAPHRAGLRRERGTRERMALAEREFPSLEARRLAVESATQRWHDTVEPGIAALRAGERLDDSELMQGKARFDEVRAAIRAYRSGVIDLRREAVAELNRDVTLLFGVLVAGLFLLLGAAVLAWVALRRWVTRPLEQLGSEVDRVEAGDLSRQVAIQDAPLEIRALAEQIDGMRVRILHEYALAEASRNEALQARALVEEQAEDLRRSNAELEQFAYVASHDLQEPLRKVASFCQLIERRYKGQLDERGEQYIEFAVDGAKRMQQLINDLLAFSRVGRVAGFSDVDLEVVLDQALRQLEAMLEESGAEVTHDPLPHVQGDASLLVQLLQNLIGNGVKFRGEEAPRIHVGVRLSPDDDEFWEFSCTDNGIGIEPQYEDKIFVIFQRLHGRDAYGGTGIGLAMCRKIVEHHGGSLWLDSRHTDGAPARPGSTFRWTLPVDVARTADYTNDDNDDRDRGTADDAAARAAGRDLARGGRPG